VFLLALACSCISRAAPEWGRWCKAGLLALLILTGLELAQHSVKWRPVVMERQVREGKLEPSFPPAKDMDVRIADGNRPGYVPLLVASGCISVAGLVLTLFCLSSVGAKRPRLDSGNDPLPPSST
jgi:hypothetical protein